jgi:hypothetical protein
VVLAALGRRDRADKPFAQFLLLALLLYPVPGALTTRAPHLNRGIHLIPLLALFVGVGAVVLADLLERAARRAAPAWRRRGLVVAALLASVTIGAELLGRYRSYVVDYPRRPEVLGYFQYGQEQAIAYAFAHEAEYDSVWLAGGNQTYMYLLFYRPWPPSDVQRALRSQRLAGTWNRVEGIGKFHFGSPSPGAVIDPVLRQTLRDPNGRATWEIRDGRAATGERILLITSIAG